MAPTLAQAIEVASRKAFVILDGTLLRIDRVGRASGYDRAFYSGEHKAHRLNVQVFADPIGRLVWLVELRRRHAQAHQEAIYMRRSEYPPRCVPRRRSPGPVPGVLGARAVLFFEDVENS